MLASCIHFQMRFDMRAEKIWRLCLAVALVSATVTGCHSASNGSTTQGSSGDSKMNGGNGENSGNNAKGSGNGASKNARTQGGPSTQLTEPATSTTGAASGPNAADSDSGSPSAVAHQSVAMPGAPEPTIKDKPTQQQKPQTGQAPPQ
jgi:hypothetical protein